MAWTLPSLPTIPTLEAPATAKQWGVLGVGYTSQIGKNQQFYIDVDRYFGNDFARTYNIRAGLNWKF